MDFTLWGIVLFNSDSFARIKKLNSNSIYNIQILDKELKVKLQVKDKIIIEFTDKILENGKLNSVTRTIKNQEYLFIVGKLILKKIKKSTNFLKPLYPQGFFSPHFLIMDLETRTIDETMIPYALSSYDGNKSNSFYLADYINSDEM
jgi:hypothetical protein